MALGGIRLDIDQIPAYAVERIATGLSRFSGDIRSLKDPLEKAVDEVVRPRIRTNFDDESYLGSAWEPLADVTVAQRERLGYGGAHPILERTGNLRTVASSKGIWTFAGQAGEAFVEDLPGAGYGVVHEYGGGEIPARPFIGVTENDVEEIGEIFAEWLEDKLNIALGTTALAAGRLVR